MPKYKFGFDQNNEMDLDEWVNSGMSTFASVLFEVDGGVLVPLGMAKSNKSVTHGAEHAEDVCLRTLQDNMSMFRPAGRNHLIFNISKTPCTSTARVVNGAALPITSNKALGCTEELIDLVTNGINHNGHNYQFCLTLLCRGLYAPGVGGDVLGASQAAVEAMRATGQIHVSGDVRPTGNTQRFEVS